MEEDTVIQWNHCCSTWLPSISKQSCHLSSVHLNCLIQIVLRGHTCHIVLKFKMMDVIRLFLQYEAQGLPHSGLWNAVFPTETTCRRFWTLLDRLSYGLHSFLRHRRHPRTFLVTNNPNSLELVDQTCNKLLFPLGLCTVTSTKQFYCNPRHQGCSSAQMQVFHRKLRNNGCSFIRDEEVR